MDSQIGMLLLFIVATGVALYFVLSGKEDELPACESSTDPLLEKDPPECDDKCTTAADIPYTGCDDTCTAANKPFTGCETPVCTTDTTTPYDGCLLNCGDFTPCPSGKVLITDAAQIPRGDTPTTTCCTESCYGYSCASGFDLKLNPETTIRGDTPATTCCVLSPSCDGYRCPPGKSLISPPPAARGDTPAATCCRMNTADETAAEAEKTCADYPCAPGSELKAYPDLITRGSLDSAPTTCCSVLPPSPTSLSAPPSADQDIPYCGDNEGVNTPYVPETGELREPACWPADCTAVDVPYIGCNAKGKLPCTNDGDTTRFNCLAVSDDVSAPPECVGSYAGPTCQGIVREMINYGDPLNQEGHQYGTQIFDGYSWHGKLEGGVFGTALVSDPGAGSASLGQANKTPWLKGTVRLTDEECENRFVKDPRSPIDIYNARLAGEIITGYVQCTQSGPSGEGGCGLYDEDAVAIYGSTAVTTNIAANITVCVPPNKSTVEYEYIPECAVGADWQLWYMDGVDNTSVDLNPGGIQRASGWLGDYDSSTCRCPVGTVRKDARRWDTNPRDRAEPGGTDAAISNWNDIIYTQSLDGDGAGAAAFGRGPKSHYSNVLLSPYNYSNWHPDPQTAADDKYKTAWFCEPTSDLASDQRLPPEQINIPFCDELHDKDSLAYENQFMIESELPLGPDGLGLGVNWRPDSRNHTLHKHFRGPSPCTGELDPTSEWAGNIRMEQAEGLPWTNELIEKYEASGHVGFVDPNVEMDPKGGSGRASRYVYHPLDATCEDIYDWKRQHEPWNDADAWCQGRHEFSSQATKSDGCSYAALADDSVATVNTAWSSADKVPDSRDTDGRWGDGEMDGRPAWQWKHATRDHVWARDYVGQGMTRPTWRPQKPVRRTMFQNQFGNNVPTCDNIGHLWGGPDNNENRWFFRDQRNGAQLATAHSMSGSTAPIADAIDTCSGLYDKTGAPCISTGEGPGHKCTTARHLAPATTSEPNGDACWSDRSNGGNALLARWGDRGSKSAGINGTPDRYPRSYRDDTNAFHNYGTVPWGRRKKDWKVWEAKGWKWGVSRKLPYNSDSEGPATTVLADTPGKRASDISCTSCV
jgi:hypothetical protein